jgi:transposase
MTKNHILGLDIAQDSVVAQLDLADGTKCWRETITTDQAGWKTLEQALTGRGARWAGTLVVLEATGVYHLPWAERLTKAGAEVHVLNPLLAARLQSVANALREHKTDRVDAHRLCEAGRLYADQLGRFRYRPEPARQGLKQLTSVRATLRASLTNLKKSLLSQIEVVFPAMIRAGLDPSTERAATILATAPTAGNWLALPEEQRRRLAGGKQAALDAACEATLADEALAQACAPAVLTLVNAQKTLAGELEECDRLIAPKLPAERVALITSVPGFGERTSAVLSVYLPADFEGWGNAKQVASRLQALFGTDPRLKQSGKWTGKIKISKRGIGAGRTALFQAAFCSLAHDPENLAYYQKLRRAGKDHKQAMVDLMRKQLRRLVSVLLSKRPFTPRTHVAA